MKIRHWKKFLSAAVVLFVVLSCAAGAFAANEAQLNIEGSHVSGSVLQIILYCDASEAPSADTLSVTLDGQPVEVKSVSPLSYADPGTTYMLLIDTNTAVTERALTDMQAIARLLVEGMGSQDNALIVPLGAEITARDLSDDPTALNAQIDALQKDSNQADLYTSMSDALTLMTESDALQPRKCLVAMADGLDSDISGVSALELSSQVSQANIPICVVALTYNTITPERVEAAKTISGFARQSPGGRSILLKTDGVTVEDAASEILGRRDSTYIVVLDGAAVRAVTADSEAALGVQMTTENGTLSDTLDISFPALPAAEATAEPVQATPAPSAVPAPTAAPNILSGWAAKLAALPGWALWTAGGALAAVIALVILLACLKSRRKKRAAKNAAGSIVRFSATSAETGGEPFGAPELCIVRMGNPERLCCELTMPASFVIGHDPRLAQLVLEDDPAIAPAQCRLIWKNGSVWTEEMSRSRNTLLNGSPLGQTQRINPGDVLRLGSYEYRIFWEQR